MLWILISPSAAAAQAKDLLRRYARHLLFLSQSEPGLNCNWPEFKICPGSGPALWNRTADWPCLQESFMALLSFR
ncbi:MAG: hypothetical protein CMF59_16820 [Leptospiraceae bacterium]|nr:hypothetical protein [Leptospiraceae bacterium]